ncbi:P-loop containing nucleoside triphosphate hydrolase protein [Armillaria borealis]|uniref:P-loop containing nucleoside triphosphate hydrolase protein n=1 Tax=Armillaria borealis TaxID=47425 RepID=A0AA39MG01_9AGAR|nr:P-loop containing nucleoside triphosphate hydrolase protein [Armillaria borealis]
MQARPRKQRGTRRKGVFDPSDSKNVTYTRVGVWDLYEEKPEVLARIPWSSRLEPYVEMLGSMPYFWRMLRDIGSIRSCWILLGLNLFIHILGALIPALTLWYSGQLLNIVQTAIDERTVDKTLLFHVAAGRVTCSLFSRLLSHAKQYIHPILNSRIKQYYSIHMFHAVARLDLPTFDDPAVQKQLEQTSAVDSGSTVAWGTINAIVNIFSTAVQLVSQLVVLVRVVYDQPDGPLIAILSFGQALFQNGGRHARHIDSSVWAATTKDEDYIRSEGLKRLIINPTHRKEIVAGGMWEYLLHEYTTSVWQVGDAGGDFWPLYSSQKARDSYLSFLQDPLRELPQIAFTLRAVQKPASIPLSLASLNLISSSASSFTFTLYSLFRGSSSVAERIASIRQLYEVGKMENRVADGAIPYPENPQTLNSGISIEFRNVSFKYPGTETLALNKVSFTIRQGQLCVIVGKNGSGKSTILKLIARLYDPLEGVILIDGLDIKTLKLADIRRATSVLFQDYTHFPLSIKDNIGFGDPENHTDEDKIRRAAELGGSEEFINKLPEGFDTYLERPVRDMYSALPEGTDTLFGRPVNFGKLRRMAGMSTTNSTSLSGGQMQRIALSRTFMRSLVSEQSVGLLLFDEPSASLDPAAEHDLFERLRQLRGNKTMVFSSHRFGNLTRHADLILYMDDSAIIEEGTHADLVRRDCEYARIWKLQAEAFLS